MSQVIRKLQDGGAVKTTETARPRTVKFNGIEKNLDAFNKDLDYNARNLAESQEELNEIYRLRDALLSREGDSAIRFENNEMIDPLGEFKYDASLKGKSKKQQDRMLKAVKMAYDAFSGGYDYTAPAPTPKQKYNLGLMDRVNNSYFGGSGFNQKLWDLNDFDEETKTNTGINKRATMLADILDAATTEAESDTEFDNKYDFTDTPFKSREGYFTGLKNVSNKLRDGVFNKEDILTAVSAGIPLKDLQQLFSDSEYFSTQSQEDKQKQEIADRAKAVADSVDRTYESEGLLSAINPDTGEREWRDASNPTMKAKPKIFGLDFTTKDAYARAGNFFTGDSILNIQDYDTWSPEQQQSYKLLRRNKGSSKIANDPIYKSIAGRGYNSISNVSSYFTGFKDSPYQLLMAQSDDFSKKPGYFVKDGDNFTSVTPQYDEGAQRWYLTNEAGDWIGDKYGLGTANAGKMENVNAIDLTDLNNASNITSAFKRIGDKLFWTSSDNIEMSKPYRSFAARLVNAYKSGKLSNDVRRHIKYDPDTNEYTVGEALTGGKPVFIKDRGTSGYEINRKRSYSTKNAHEQADALLHDKGPLNKIVGSYAHMAAGSARTMIRKDGGVLKGKNGLKNTKTTANWDTDIATSKGFTDWLDTYNPDNYEQFNNLQRSYANNLKNTGFAPGNTPINYNQGVFDRQSSFNNVAGGVNTAIEGLANTGKITRMGNSGDNTGGNFTDGYFGEQEYLRHGGNKTATSEATYGKLKDYFANKGLKYYLDEGTGMYLLDKMPALQQAAGIARSAEPVSPIAVTNNPVPQSGTTPIKGTSTVSPNKASKFGKLFGKVGNIANNPNVWGAARYFNSQASNARIRDIKRDAIQPVIGMAANPYKKVVGDLPTKNYYQQQAAGMQSWGSRPFTSNAEDTIKRQFGAQVQANDYAMKGNLADAEMVRRTGEEARNMDIQNEANRVQLGNENMSRIAQAKAARADIDAAYESTKATNTNTLLSEVEGDIRNKRESERAFQAGIFRDEMAREWDANQKQISNLTDTAYKRWKLANPKGDINQFMLSPEYQSIQNTAKNQMENFNLDSGDKYNAGIASIYGYRMPQFDRTKSWRYGMYKKGGQLSYEEKAAIENTKAQSKANLKRAELTQKSIEKSIDNNVKLIENMSSLTKELILRAMKV